MGIVYEAEQISLNRRVALKVLPFAAALNPRQLQRFKTEAQAAAQLHHTHIVPVYAVGCEQGVHYYAMQLIDGQSLAGAVTQTRRHAGLDDGDETGSVCLVPGGSPDSTVLQVPRPSDPAGDASTHDCSPRPSARTAPATTSARTSAPPHAAADYFRRVALLGAQAAEALDYAHQLGVVHRDIKPANLMVDARGHLWVADFGLALTTGESGLTLTGELLGTLRYMSPEQAAARRGVVDHRTDVYALGATLYELLTLEPAFDGSNRAELFAQIANDDPVPPRRRNRAVPPELETVVLKCLAKDPAERYATAQELADDLRRFLADQPVRARRPTPVERLRRWARRHRRAVACAIFAAAFAAGCLAVSAVLLARQRDEAVYRERQARKAVDEWYTEVAEKWLSRSLHPDPGLQRVYLQRARAFYEEFARDPGRDPDARLEAGRAARRVADIHYLLGEADHAEAAYADALARCRRLAAERPDLTGARAEWAVALNHRLRLLRDAGRLTEALHDARAAVALFARLAEDDPAAAEHRDGLAGSHTNLALTLQAIGQPTQAEAEYATALALRERLVADDPDAPNLRADLAGCAADYGLLLEELGRPAEAEKLLNRAVCLWRKLTAGYPTWPPYRQALAAGVDDLARLAAAAGRFADAEKGFQEALALRERLRAEFPPVAEYRRELAATHQHRGVALAAAGDFAAAEQALGAAYALRHALVEAYPGVAAHGRALADTHQALGDLLVAQGRWRAADKAYQAALALREKRVADRSGPAPDYELAVTRHALGRVRAVCGAAAEAERLLCAAQSALAEQADNGPPAWALALTAVEIDLGRLLTASSRPAEAGAVARRAAERAERLAAAQPAAPAPRELLAGAWTLVGSLSLDRPDESARAFGRALAVRRQMAEESPARPRDRAELAWLLATCPDARFRDPARAVALARQATAQAPHDGTAWNRLGVALCRAGDWPAAAAALEQSVRLRRGGDRTDWLFLALAYRRLGESEKARPWADRLVEADGTAAPDPEWARLRAEAGAGAGS